MIPDTKDFMKQLQIFFLSILTLTACSKNQPPEGVLDEQRMVSVLADLTVIDGYMSTLMYTDSLRIRGKNFYATVYKHHNISKETFENSMKYYSSQPVLLDSMYSRVARKLEAKEKVLNKIQMKEQFKKVLSK